MKIGQNFAAASYIPNFYDDDIAINGFKIIGITNPDALNYYRYKLVGRRMLDKKVVYDIRSAIKASDQILRLKAGLQCLTKIIFCLMSI